MTTTRTINEISTHYGSNTGRRRIAGVLLRCPRSEQVRRHDVEAGRFSLIFLAAPGDHEAQVELTTTGMAMS